MQKQRRMTKQKQLVLGVVQAHHDHPTADEVYLEVRALDGRISRGTVFRNLDQLSGAGDLLQVKLSGANRFDSRLEYHYHLLCTHCQKLIDVPMDYEGSLDRQVTEKTGYEVSRHRTVFEGLCPQCRKLLDAAAQERPHSPT